MSIEIRVDDYPGSKTAEFWKHNRENFEKFDDIIHEITGKSYLLGVIPIHTSDEDLKWLSTRNIVIGMHGTNHDERFQNQFGDLYTKHEICTLLHPHRKRLQDLTGQSVNTYLPPHNAIDGKTISALSMTGFKAFTSGPGSLFKQSFLHDGAMNCLHSEAPLEYGRSDELLQRNAVEHLQQDKHFFLTLHWPWEHNIGLEHLKVFLSQIKDKVIDFSI